MTFILEISCRDVNSENRNLIITMGVFMIIVVGGYAALHMYTGFSTPFSVVMSQSMQDDPYRSEIGSIDTGDVVIVQSPEKAEIQSYIEGLSTGFSSFGDYGSVIIYERGNNQNPVIHRAILWLDYNGDGTWSAPALADYDSRKWYVTGTDGSVSHDYMHMSGTLSFTDLTKSHKGSDKPITVNLDTMNKNSGFLTMGDNRETNKFFDQSSIVNHPIGMDSIRSIPVIEIPWIGALKILIKNDGDNLEYVPNSIPSLIMSIVFIFSILMVIDIFSMSRNIAKINHGKSKLEEEW